MPLPLYTLCTYNLHTIKFRPPRAFANRGSWKIGIERQWDGRNMEDEKERLSLDADGKPKARRIRTHWDALLHHD